MHMKFKTKLLIILIVILNSIFTYASSNIIDNSKPFLLHEKTYIQYYLENQIMNAGVGGSIIFGKYEQDNILENGLEDIEWIVLAYDDKNCSAVLISRYALDCYSINGFHENVRWENCSLRAHMNNDMMLSMFNDEELSCIVPTRLENSPNFYNGEDSGSPTTDFLYLPGLDEMYFFFSNPYMVNEAKIEELLKPNKNRVCHATSYAVARGVRVIGGEGKDKMACNYFLRTTGLSGHRIWYGDVYADYYQSFVSETGEVKPNGTGITSMDDGIRVMMQVKF